MYCCKTCKQNFPFPSKLLGHEQSAKHIVLSQIMQAVEEKEGAELHRDLDIADVNMPEPSDLHSSSDCECAMIDEVIIMLYMIENK